MVLGAWERLVGAWVKAIYEIPTDYESRWPLAYVVNGMSNYLMSTGDFKFTVARVGSQLRGRVVVSADQEPFFYDLTSDDLTAEERESVLYNIRTTCHQGRGAVPSHDPNLR